MPTSLRIWSLIAALGGLALLAARALADVPPVVGIGHLPWPALALAIFVAESSVVNVYFGRDAQSFSLSEVPFVVGLVVLSPSELLVAQLVGSVAALILVRRQPVQKLYFNVAQFGLGTAVAAVGFQSAVSPGTELGPAVWVGCIAAVTLKDLVGHFTVPMAIVLSGGRPDFSRLPRVLALGLGASLTNTSLGLVAITLVALDVRAMALLVLPCLTIFLAYRAYMRERQQHEQVEFLFQSTRILHRNPELDASIIELLQQACDMFRGDVGELTLLRNDGRILRSVAGPDVEPETMRPADLLPGERAWLRSVTERHGVLLQGRSPADDPLRHAIASRGIKAAMVVPLIGEARVLGMVMVGALDDEHGPFDRVDLQLFETLVNHVAVMLQNGQLEQSLEQLRRLEAQLKHQAFHDPLTSLANRTLFTKTLEESLDARGPGSLAVLFVDLDDFKTVNDTLGHAAGDALLQTVAERLKRCIRPEDVAARLGGDEFAVLLEGVDDAAEAATVARRILGALREPISLPGGDDVRVGASVGIAMGVRGSETADDVVRHADVAMYTAKGSGKGRYAVFAPSMQQAVQERHELVADLQRALERDELTLHYQPLVSLGDGQIVGVESLLRWQHPVRGTIQPDRFVALAEETGLIMPIGRWVLRAACAQGARWIDELGPRRAPLVHVNISARQLEQPGFVGELVAALRETGLPASRLVLEITENVLVDDTDVMVERLHEVKGVGVGISIDDFGTGYSSFSYLARLPIDELKVPKPFVDTIGTDARDAAFAQAITALGRSLGLTVVAEGIETPRQVELLTEWGCELGQGFVFSPACGAAGMTALLAAAPFEAVAASAAR